MRSVWKEEIDWSQLLWRYLKVSRFAEMLDRSQLYFAASTQFTDKFEGATAVLPPDFPLDPRFAPMDHMEDAYFKWRFLFKINCWHRAEYESNAMWRLYAEESKGVAICSTPERMRAAIKPYYVNNPDYPEILWAGAVKYYDFLKVRLPASGNTRYFSKHEAFSWEREFRLLISMMEANEFGVDVTLNGISVRVDLEALIEAIFIGPELSKENQEIVIERSRKAGLGAKIQKSSLLGQPRFI